MLTDFDRTVQAATSDLPGDQLQALWLVDTCRLSYDQAAEVAGASAQAIADRVATGRRFIRQRLVASH